MDFASLMDTFVVDGTFWLGESALNAPHSFNVQLVRAIALMVVGFVFAIVFYVLFKIIDAVSLRFFKPYKSLRFIAKVDWTSRWVALVFIVIHVYTWYKTANCQHPLEPVEMTKDGQHVWRMRVDVERDALYWCFIHFAIMWGYEAYDLKNCVDIKMPSGVLHHIILLMILPPIWFVTRMTSFAVAMGAITYLSNIPAHIRSFMAHMGMRESHLYNLNKSAWWYSYVICRLFGIPWFSAQMWYLRRAVIEQSHVAVLSFYFFSMAIHYGLSVYWFNGMTKTFITPTELKRNDSFPILKKKGTSEDSEDEGGQKFD